MPNWCSNRMVITGGKRELQRFMKCITVYPRLTNGETYDMNSLVPLDPRTFVTRTYTSGTDDEGNTVERSVSAFADEDEDGFDGYSHAVERWGSKWGACSITLASEEDNELVIHFDTAWNPADNLIRAISKDFPGLVFGVSSEDESRDNTVWTVFHYGDTVETEFTNTSKIPPHLAELHDRLDTDEANDSDYDEYYEELAEWYNGIVECGIGEMRQVMDEYTKHIAYVRRCERKGVIPRDFVSSI